MSDFTCPHLGRADDPETAFAFSSPGHRCFRLDTPSPVAEGHQNSYCLSENYTDCPVFRFASSLLGAEEQPSTVGSSVQLVSVARSAPSTPVPAPRPQPVPPAASEPFIQNPLNRIMNVFLPLFQRFGISFPQDNPAVPAIFVTTLAILVISLLFFLIVAVSFMTSPSIGSPSAATVFAPAAEEQGPNVFIMTLTPTQRSAVIKKLGVAHNQEGRSLSEASGQPANPDTIVVTPTVAPTAASYHACGAPANWVPYTVQTGDSLTGLTVVYDISLGELSSYNCLSGTEGLYIGQKLFVPPQ